jgi:CheY-like chemotaxis protein
LRNPFGEVGINNNNIDIVNEDKLSPFVRSLVLVRKTIMSEDMSSVNKSGKISILLNSNKIRRVLLVDDNMFNLFILESYLKKLSLSSFDIKKAYSGQEAIDIFIKNNCDPSELPIEIIFMDCQMPEMDGYETTVAIIEYCEERNLNPPIITACTAYEGREEEQMCYEAGMKYFLRKPISEEELRVFIQQILKL